MTSNVPVTSTFSYLGLGLSTAGRRGASPAVGTPPVNTVAPLLTGTTDPYPGKVLGCGAGTWANTPTGFAYQWLRNGVSIGGANVNSYTMVAADIGAALTCQVTATNADGSGAAVSSNNVARVFWSPVAYPRQLTRWYDCSIPAGAIEVSNLVTQLTDQSGSGNHLVQALVPSQPPARSALAAFNNRTVLRLIGPQTTGPYMTGTSTFRGSTITVIAMVQMDVATGVNSPKLLSFTPTGVGDASEGALQAISQPATSAALRCIGYTGGGQSSQVVYTGLTEGPLIFVSQFNAVNVRTSKNGSAWTNTNVLPTPMSFVFDTVTLGANRNAASWGIVRAVADIAEIAIDTDAAITQAEIDQIVGYLAHKWAPNVVTALPAGHPYKAAPP